MQFLTILTPKRERYSIRVNTGARGMYFDFEFEIHGDPGTEGVTVAFDQGLRGQLPREFWPDVAAGARRGWEWAREYGRRLCCVRFTLIAAKCHDVDTSSRGVQSRVAGCIADRVSRTLAEPLLPLHKGWLTSDVVALARGIHATAALDGIPALCDALLEAGCDDPLVTEHLRTCPDHSPSCWVVEMILEQLAAAAR